MQDATITQTGDQVVLMGAASKGIIQRGHQHNAMVYKSPYAKNPFDCVTDEELDEYKKVVEKKTKGDCKLKNVLILNLLTQFFRWQTIQIIVNRKDYLQRRLVKEWTVLI